MAATANDEQGTPQRELGTTTALAKRQQGDEEARLRLHADEKRRSVAFAPAKGKRWQPPEGLTPADAHLP